MFLKLLNKLHTSTGSDMRYSTNENTVLLGNFPPGSIVNIVLVDLATDKAVTLNTDACPESEVVPGLFTWSTRMMDDPAMLVGYHDIYYIMEDMTGVTFQGKFVYGGYPDRDYSAELAAVGFDGEAILRVLHIINARVP